MVKGVVLTRNGQEVLAWATTELSAGPTVGIARIHPEAGGC